MRGLVIGLIFFGVLPVAARQTMEDRAAARAIVMQHADAMLSLRVTVHVSGSVNGKDLPSKDQTVAAPATVLDSSGLAVCALSRLEPDSSMNRALVALAPSAKTEINTEVTGVQMRLATGRDVTAHIVLRDPDLDLAFVRPADPLSGPVPAIDGPSARPGLLDMLVVLLHGTTDQEGDGVAAGLGYVESIVLKPRLYYTMAGPTTAGAPVFDRAGNFVGLIVQRQTNARGTTAVGILPADDLRSAAKQAK